ncbi:hypothetical protein K8I28_05185 [bacterium]|nr:hypothetical protein [bacterium]
MGKVKVFTMVGWFLLVGTQSGLTWDFNVQQSPGDLDDTYYVASETDLVTKSYINSNGLTGDGIICTTQIEISGVQDTYQNQIIGQNTISIIEWENGLPYSTVGTMDNYIFHHTDVGDGLEGSAVYELEIDDD